MNKLALIHLNSSFIMFYQANFQKFHLNSIQPEINVTEEVKN